MVSARTVNPTHVRTATNERGTRRPNKKLVVGLPPWGMHPPWGILHGASYIAIHMRQYLSLDLLPIRFCRRRPRSPHPAAQVRTHLSYGSEDMPLNMDLYFGQLGIQRYELFMMEALGLFCSIQHFTNTVSTPQIIHRLQRHIQTMHMFCHRIDILQYD